MSAPNHNNKNNNIINSVVPSKKLKITKTTTSSVSMSMSMSMSMSNIKTLTNNSNSNKNDVGGKDDVDDEFETIKEYLLKCPLVASVHDSPAIKAALEGIEKEQKRRIRDAKLRSKFLGSASSSSSSNSNSNSRDNNDDGDEIVVVEKDEIGVPVARTAAVSSIILESNSNSNDNDDMEWQDVQQQQKDEDAMVPAARAIGDSFTMEQSYEESSSSTEPCFLGRTLSRACIDAIAEQQQHQHPVEVSTPLAAIAVALHAALRSDVLGFACTGIPEDVTTNKKKKGKSIGFAPPIRELPKTQFLPRGWDDDNNSSSNNSNRNSNNNNINNNIQPFLQSPPPLRYRKTDTGAVVLTVEGHPSGDDNDQVTTECRVTFVPANSKEEDSNSTHPSSCLRFPLSEHINLDSWNAAAAAARKTKNKTSNTNTNYQHKIAPSLHYKNLSGLLSKFCRAFDLGAVHDEKAIESRSSSDGMMTRTKISGSSSSNNNNNSSSKKEVSGVFAENHHATTSRNTTGYSVPSTLDQAFPPPPGAAAAAARRNNDPTAIPLVDYAPPHHRGDFADDLLPASSSGLQDPRFGRVGGGRMGGRMGGNLMGPNHPIFSPGSVGVGGDYGNDQFPGMGGLPIGGPGTMQPRFDPLMPPGIGGDDFPPPPGSLAAANSRRLRGRTVPGEPNPDHLPPPNSLGNNNMFM
jgi:hypothetical protein